MLKKLSTILFVSFLVGCATNSKEVSSQWIFDKAWYEKNDRGTIVFNGLGGRTNSVRGEFLWNYYQVSSQLINLSQITTALVITNHSGLNAFAYQSLGVNHIGITIDMLNTFGGDREALAAIIGHELAHLKLKHQSERASRKRSAENTTAVVGGVLGSFIPFGGALTNFGATAINNIYSRDEERDADMQGMLWAVTLGYSPCGFARVSKELMKKNQSSVAFLSTHPISSERFETANQYAVTNNYGNCQ